MADMHRELEAIADDPEVPAPVFIFVAIPIPGTPFFRDRWERGLLLPDTRVRDLEGSTLSTVTSLGAGRWVTYESLALSYWLTLALAIPTGGFLLRLMVLQHDLAHGSLLPSKWAGARPTTLRP